jgi:hypothetical protein
MGGELITITTRPCPECGKRSEVAMTIGQRALWLSPHRPLIQNIFPDWSNDQRELLITGIHPECWAKIFPPEEEEEFGDDELYPIRQGDDSAVSN